MTFTNHVYHFDFDFPAVEFSSLIYANENERGNPLRYVMNAPNEAY